MPLSPPRPWPLISIVIPSFNYGRFLERALQSVLGQSYPHRQLIVVDGGSSDCTASLLSRYAAHIHVCIQEPDRGQTDALNKGIAHATGELFSWLNADDAFRSDAFETVAQLWRRGYDLIGGRCCNHHELEKRQELVACYPYSYGGYFDFVDASFRGFLPQPAVFASTALARSAFPLDMDLRRAMDYQYFLRLLRQAPKQSITDSILVDFYYHGANLTGSDVPLLPELITVCEREIATWPEQRKRFWNGQLAANQHLQRWLDAASLPRVRQLLSTAQANPPLLRRRLWWKLLISALLRSLRGQR